ncbi:MAG TPA: hypothetical protein VMI54_21675 [Polyangiaceae bacterium]|nr:hypothetical protein [Polyangiaceae bacterium]
MIDESAFGLLIAYLTLEDDEYAGERADFVARHAGFVELCRARLGDAPPGQAPRALELGHALYVELVEGAHAPELISWLKQTRAALAERGYGAAGILTYGSTWLDVEARAVSEALGQGVIVRASGPSEPFRRALMAEAAARGGDETDDAGWGPGLYLDVDAVEALGKKPKNAPTILRAGGAEFYRSGQ